MARAVTAASRPGVPLAAWAGFIAGPACWFGQQFLFLSLAQAGCGSTSHRVLLLAVSAVLCAVLIAAGSLSWRIAAGLGGRPPVRFAAFIGTAAAALFLLVVIWQGAAGLIFSGCER